jgi:hypothetical protein
MGIVTIGTVILGHFVPVLALKQRFVASLAGKCRLRRGGMGIVALAALHFKDGGMNNFTCSLHLMTRFTCSLFHCDGQQCRLRGGVRIVAITAHGSQDHLAVPALVHLIMAFEAQVRQRLLQLVFMGSGMGFVTGAAPVFHRRMDISPRCFFIVAFIAR